MSRTDYPEEDSWHIYVLTLFQSRRVFNIDKLVCYCCDWRVGELLQVGAFSFLFSSHFLVVRANWNSVFEAELQDVIPICHATIAGTRIVGRLTAGYVVASD